jgi:four helix bundle protein
MGGLQSFESLECWKKCRELRLFIINRIVPVLPTEEKYRLKDQIIRAARSSTANIAEGYGRFHYLDTAKFCCNARGSVYEVLDHLITAIDESQIDQDLFDIARNKIEESIKLLNGYIHYLQDKANSK